MGHAIQAFVFNKAHESPGPVKTQRTSHSPLFSASVATPMPEHSYAGPILVTVSYLLLWYYLLLLGQSRTKYRLKAQYEREGKVFDRYFGQDPEMLAADRAVANTLEQMGPFLVSLWMFAVFVSPQQAGWYGAAYVLLRALYPLLLGKRVTNTQSKRVAFVTFPAYLIVFSMLGRTVAALV